MSESLLAACWTTAGDANPYPGQDRSPYPLRTRIEEAAAAGFVGFGLLDVDLRHFLASSDLPTLRKILEDNGIEFFELEFLTNWWTTGALREQSDELRRLLLSSAEVLGARTIKAAPALEGGPLNLDLLATELHRIGVEAQEHGTTIALECMAFTNVPNLSTAMELLRAADHPAVGLEIDAWHIDRCHTTMEELSTVPLSAIKGVELDDGLRRETDDPYRDTVENRRLMGRGEFQLPSLINTLQDVGWQGPWGVEILSLDYRVRDLTEALADVVATSKSMFEVAALNREERA